MLRRVAAAYLTGRPVEELRTQGEEWFAAEGARAVYPDAWQLVRRYQGDGIPVVLLSGGMDFLVGPLARAIGATRWAAVEPDVAGGVCRGRLREPLCIDAGKLAWARAVAPVLGADLADCAYHTDDFGDLALLEAVGERVVVNPDPRLRREATRRGWPIVDFAPPVDRGGAPGRRAHGPLTPPTGRPAAGP